MYLIAVLQSHNDKAINSVFTYYEDYQAEVCCYQANNGCKTHWRKPSVLFHTPAPSEVDVVVIANIKEFTIYDAAGTTTIFRNKEICHARQKL